MPSPVALRRLTGLLIAVLLLHALPQGGTPVVYAADGAAEAVREPREVATNRRSGVVRHHPLVTVPTASGQPALARRLVVGYRAGVGAAERAAVHRVAASAGAGTRPLAPIGPFAELLFVTGAATLDAVVQQYLADPRVAYAEPDYVVRAALTPNDPLFSQQWGLEKIRARAAWDVTTGSAAQAIAVLDCGIYEAGASLPFGRPGHPDLNDKVLDRIDLTGSPYGADDRCDHGSHVAGIAAAATNNGVGVAGTGFQTMLLNGKVLDDDGVGSNAWVALGIRWAVDSGASVINMSLSGPFPCPSVLRDAVTYAANRQVIVVAAAGNDGLSEPNVPANCPGVIGVGSTTQSDQRSSFSNYGASWVDLAAPGDGILSTVASGGYASFSGTSMASPFVAGVAALVRATGAFTSAASLADHLNATADAVLGTGSVWRAGRVNAQRAVSGLRPTVVVDGGHAVVGAQAPARSWYFAEGYTASGFDEYLSILNPNSNPVFVTITYFLPGGATQASSLTVQPRSRATVAVHDANSGGVGRIGPVSARVETDDPGGIVVERPIYFRYNDRAGGGHNTLGAPQPSSTWYFAEGWTGDGFDQYLTIVNPSTTATTATITFFLSGNQPPVVRQRALPAQSRVTVVVHDAAEGVGRNQAVATRVTTPGVGIIVERPMYFRYGDGIDGGHIVMGATATAPTWYFAEGWTGDGFDQYLTVLNPSSGPTAVTVTYFLSNGATREHRLTVGAMSRATVTVHSPTDGVGRNQAVAARVSSDGVGIVVERPMYFRYGSTVRGGHNVLGAPAPAAEWYFAEGWTGDGFDAYLTILNPAPTPASITITYFLTNGGAKQVDRTVPPTSRTTIAVHDPTEGVGRNQAVSARVTTSSATGIVVERPMYFVYQLA